MGRTLGEFPQWDVRTAVTGNVGHIFTAISYVGLNAARAITSGTLEVKRSDGTSDDVAEHWFLDLIRNPYPEMPGVDLWNLCSAWSDLAGHWWLWAVPGRDHPIALVPLLPDRVRVVLGTDRPIVGVNYYPDGFGGRRIGIPREELVRRAEPDPTGGYLTGGAGYYGWPKMRAAAQARELADSNMKMRLAFYQNQARPDYVLAPKLPKGRDAVDMMRRFRASVLIHHQGIERYGMPLVVPEGTEVKTLNFVSEAMDLIGQANLSRDDVFEIFGTSPLLHGHYEAAPARATLEAAESSCAKSTLDPRVGGIVGALQSDLLDRYVNAREPQGRRLVFCVPSLAPEDTTAQLAKSRGLYVDGIAKRNEARRMVGLAPDDDADGYKYELEPQQQLGGLSQVQAIRAVRAVAGPHVPAPLCLRAAFEIASKGVLCDDTARALHGDREPEPIVIETRALPPVTRKAVAPIDHKSDEERADYWSKAVRPMDDETTRGTRVAAAMFRAQAARLLPEIEAALPALVGKFAGWARPKVLKWFASKASALDLGIDWAAEDGEIDRVLRPLVRRAAQAGGDYMAELVGLDFDVDNPAAAKWLESHVPKLAGDVNETTRAAIGGDIRYGVAEGESTQEISARIRETFRTWEGDGGPGEGAMPGYRAARIARTEVSSAFGYAQTEVMAEAVDLGIATEMEWITARDSVVRESHRIDGERRKPGEKFSNGCEYPGDPAGGVEEIVNCRCTVAPVIVA